MRRLLKLIKVRKWQLAYRRVLHRDVSLHSHIHALSGTESYKKGKKVENIQLNALVSWEVSFTVFHLRMECMLFMSDLTPNADSYVGFWMAKMKASKSSVSFPSSLPRFQNYQNKTKNWELKLDFSSGYIYAPVCL